MKRRVVVTGIGAITPIGSGVDGLWDGIRRGHSAVTRVSRFDASAFRSQLAAEVSDFDGRDYVDAREARRLDRYALLALSAAVSAVDDAQLNLSTVRPWSVGVSMGSALGGVAFGEDQHTSYLTQGMKGVSPMLAIAVYGGASGANIALHMGLRGPNLAISNSCASGAIAIGEAFEIIRRRDADIVLAGGAEAPLAPLTYGAFSLIKAMSARNDDPAGACRPFDSQRDGFVMGEGAAVLVLEERDAALRRGARVYAEILGYAHTNDAYHMTAPRPDGSEAARAVCGSLRSAGLEPEQIGYVNAHATGTPLGDAAEVMALRGSLGAHASCVPVSGTKALYGHALGASGAIEAAIVALGLNRGFFPGTYNCDCQDSVPPIRILGKEGLYRKIGFALTTSFGFGGANAALIFGRGDT
ncbi:MAG TPA: beta-ketoacyl-[acyl-carrier-protein] synthase family protein [Chloroflexota bacterium]